VSVEHKYIRCPAWSLRLLVTLVCMTCAGLSANGESAAANIDIGKNKIGAPPSDFDPLQGAWTVVRDPTTAGLAIEQSGAQTSEDQFPLAIYKRASVKNAEISVRLNAMGGKSDQGGGLALRLTSPKDYYLVRLDALRDRVVFSAISDGGSKEIVAVDADVTAQTWHTLEVRAKNNEFIVSLDGSWVFTGFDKTLSQAGHIALWTKGDSVTRFDSIAIIPLPTVEER
jgi:hypothetical protein